MIHYQQVRFKNWALFAWDPVALLYTVKLRVTVECGCIVFNVSCLHIESQVHKTVERVLLGRSNASTFNALRIRFVLLKRHTITYASNPKKTQIPKF